MRYIRLYWYFFIQRLKISLEHRANFFIGTFSTVVLQFAGILTLWVVTRYVPRFHGWTFHELLLIYGLLTTAKSINHMFADNLWIIGWEYIHTGKFDRFLLRPINPLFHLLADRFCHDGIGNFLIGAILVGTTSATLGISWTPLMIFYLCIAVLSGGIIFIALNLITAVCAFWMVNSTSVTQVVFNTHEFAKYPLSIYPQAIGILMTWVIPYGFASFYSANFLLGRDMGVMPWIGPVVALGLFALGYRFWQFGLRQYSGTGS